MGNKGIVIDPLTNKAKTTIRNTTKPEDTILNMSIVALTRYIIGNVLRRYPSFW